MTRGEHVREAERLLAESKRVDHGGRATYTPESAGVMVAQAHVHALLASVVPADRPAPLRVPS